MTSLTETFETQTCGRCGGSGHYSYCQSWGTTCFGCSGKGIVYSKRGEAALQYGRTLRMVKTSEVQPGWLLFVQAGPCGGRTGWFTVTKAETTTNEWHSESGASGFYFLLETSQGGLYTFPESMEQAVPNKARLTEVKALALAYQATLLKTGKVAKRLSQVA
jgi:hypothetical protein